VCSCDFKVFRSIVCWPGGERERERERDRVYNRDMTPNFISFSHCARSFLSHRAAVLMSPRVFCPRLSSTSTRRMSSHAAETSGPPQSRRLVVPYEFTRTPEEPQMKCASTTSTVKVYGEDVPITARSGEAGNANNAEQKRRFKSSPYASGREGARIGEKPEILVILVTTCHYP